MPSYNPKVIERRWQDHWRQHNSFRTPDLSDKPKYYILDMFPYPSARACTSAIPRATRPRTSWRATSACAASTCCIRWAGMPSVCRPSNTPSRPARIRASPPQENIDNFRRQIQMLGFSYDWDREVDTTDPNYFRWTQWIFLQLFDTWYDAEQKKGRPIAELPIPPEVQKQGEAAVRALPRRQTLGVSGRGAGQLVRGAGHGAGQRGSHRRQIGAWRPSRRAHAAAAMDAAHHRLCRAPARRLGQVWIGRNRSRKCSATGSAGARGRRSISLLESGLAVDPRLHDPARHAVRRHLYGAGPRASAGRGHHHGGTSAAVQAYKTEAARKSDLERTEAVQEEDRRLHRGYRDQSGQSGESAHLDRRLRAGQLRHRSDHGGAGARPARLGIRPQFNLPIRPVVQPPEGHQPSKDETALAYQEGGQLHYPFAGEGTAINSGRFNGLATAEFKHRSPPGWRNAVRGAGGSITSCATGFSAASVTGASRSRSCTKWMTRAIRPALSAAVAGRIAAASARTGGLQAVAAGPSRPWARPRIGWT